MICLSCEKEIIDDECPCSWTSYYAKCPAGYELASVSDLPASLNQDIRTSISHGMSVILYGPSGSGKTHAAVAHAKNYSNEMQCEFSVYSKFHPVSEYLSVPILIINELNDSHYDLCEDRHGNGLITIATTNLISLDDAGSLVSSIDNRFIQWRFDCHGLTEPLTKKWIIKRREEKRQLYNWWKEQNVVEENEEYIDISELIGED